MQKSISVTIRATYETYGNLSEKTECIWVVCHGYGQLAKHFIRRFDILDPEKCFVIAPQGLSKFYLEEFGRVGASWLTRENKDMELQNQLDYIEAVFKQATEPIDLTSVKINLLGFSQGTATATRFAIYRNIFFDKLVLWAGILPREMDHTHFEHLKSVAMPYLVIGKQDKLFQGDRVEKAVAHMTKTFKTPIVILFDGEHKMERTVLTQVIEPKYLLNRVVT